MTGFWSGDEHAVPVTEEAITLGHGIAIRLQDLLAAGECADQHEQARLRKVKVREQRGNEPELKAGRDEYFCFAAMGLEFSAAGSQCFGRGGFEGTDASGANCDDSAALAHGAVEGFGS